MWRTKDRQVKHSGHLDVVDISPVSGKEFQILPSAERLADIRRRRLCTSRHGGRPSEGLDPGSKLDLQRPGAARLAQHLDIGLGAIPPGSSVLSGRSAGSGRRALRTPPSMTKCATWMPFGPSSRALLCASPRSANLPIAKAAECGYPFTLALAPVNRIAPRPCGIMRRAASRTVRNPPNAEISMALRTAFGSSSAIGPWARALAL